MEKWRGKVALVTGASSGFGAEIAIDLAKAGVITIGMARRVEKVEELKSRLDKETTAKNLHAIHGDVTDEESVKKVFDYIKETFGGVNILINNAGTIRNKMLLSDDESNTEFRDVMNTNVLGMVYCTRLAYRQLKENDAFGYIVNINSTYGHDVPFPHVQAELATYNLYNGSKYAVTATTEVLRQELILLRNKKVRISSISPGNAATEIFNVAGIGDLFTKESGPMLNAEDISQAVLYVLGTPDHVQVKELIIKPFGELY